MRSGEVLDDKYEIVKIIGRGGMSVVYLATDLHLHQKWAVKEIPLEKTGAAGSSSAAGILREADLMKKLDHPALPRIVDILEEDHRIYIVMDYIEGESLYRILQRKGPFSEKEIREIGIRLCDVLQYLHTRTPPVIYRDMKPSHVIRKPDGDLKLIDLGIAREYKRDREEDTRNLGTEGYAAPEQHGAGQTDPRSDIFALGMTLLSLLTGVAPQLDPYLYREHPVRKLRPDASRGMERILNRCTAFRPEDRYQSCREVRQDLEHPERLPAARRRNKRQRERVLCLAVCALLVLAVFGSVAVRAAAAWNKEQEYRRLLSAAVSTPEVEKIRRAKQAVVLDGSRPEAYLKLLEIWQEQGCFTEEDSAWFTEHYSRNQAAFSSASEDLPVLDLAYQAGATYLYLYSGGDGSFRERILLSLPFFRKIQESGRTDYKNYSLAVNYCALGEFYQAYVCNAIEIREPKKAEYDALLKSFRLCLEEMGKKSSPGSAYVNLLTDQEMLHILNDQRRGLAAEKIPVRTVQDLTEEICRDAKNKPVTRTESVELQEEILQFGVICLENIERTYENTRDT